MYFYRQSLETKFPRIISTHIFHQTRVPIRHRPVVITRSPLSALASTFGCFFSKHASTKSCQLADGIGVRGGGGGGGDGGWQTEAGDGATQCSIVLHVAGPVMASVHVYFALKRRSVEKHIQTCAHVAAYPVHEEMSWLNAEAE